MDLLERERERGGGVWRAGGWGVVVDMESGRLEGRYFCRKLDNVC